MSEPAPAADLSLDAEPYTQLPRGAKRARCSEKEDAWDTGTLNEAASWASGDVGFWVQFGGLEFRLEGLGVQGLVSRGYGFKG